MRTLLRLAAAACALLSAVPAALAQDAGSDGPVAVSRLDADPAFARGRPLRFASRAQRLDAIDRVRFDAKGRIVVAGRKQLGSGRSREGVARFLPNGRIDRSFGRRGVAFLRVDAVEVESDDQPFVPGGGLHDLSIDADGRILLAGEYESSDGERYLAIRLRPNGSLDRTFSGDGLLENSGQYGRVWLAARTSPADGSVLALAWQAGSWAVARVTPAGERDTEFGVAGVAVVPAFILDIIRVTDFDVDAQGRALVASTVGVRRLDTDGNFDPSIGTGGWLRRPDGHVVEAKALAIDAQGRILVLGRVGSNFGSTVDTVHRFLPDGAPDTSFSGDGREDWSGALDGQFGSNFEFAVAANAERYAIAAVTSQYDFETGTGSSALCVGAIDGAAPDELGVFSEPTPTESGPDVRDLGVSPDGRFAIVAGTTRGMPLLRRVDLTPREPIPLPDLSVAWDGPVEVTGETEVQLTARIALTNHGAGDWADAPMFFYLSDDEDVDPYDYGVLSPQTGIVPAGETVHLTFTTTPLHRRDAAAVSGKRLLAWVNFHRNILEADTRDDLAASAAIE